MKKSISCPSSPRSGNLKRCYSDSKLYDKNENYSIIYNNNNIENVSNWNDNSQSEDVILPIENISNQINIPKTINDNDNKNASYLSSDILEESMFL